MLLEAGDAKSAIKKWQAALDLLPQPAHLWDASVWLHASIGEARRALGLTNEALESFRNAEASAQGHSNAFVQLGIGTCLYDLGRAEESIDPLLRAFMMEGAEIFEESDPAYLDYLRLKRLID
ncbi:hypothetical protein [Rhizobium mongolense]|uniref:Tetratricopeptide (TPR) repeat protein n=1 Tax=Rhizobium mongolense TaxID=57676 RepID=A0A7W6WFE3_9HYPH|nr:hypothetical protein [Rhizobium mongolense]MBB4275599.1 tetratricopeptide (TPR) repeat protein [Rhizobium mongolense]